MDSYTDMLLVAREVALEAERKGFSQTAEAMRCVIDNFLNPPPIVCHPDNSPDELQRLSRET